MSQLIAYNSRGIMLAYVLIVGVVTLASGTTLAMDPRSGDPQSSTATLNQSVALDAEDNQRLAGSNNISASRVGAADASSSVSATDGAVTEYLPPRGERNGFRAGKKTLPAAKRSTPWYSSGFGAMAVVFVAIGIVYILVRKYMPGSVIAPYHGVKIIGSVALSPKHRAVLVKLGERAILIGLGGDHMSTLAEITDRDEVARLSQEANPGTAAMSPEFNSWLRREQEDYGIMADDEVPSASKSSRESTRSPIGDLLDKLRSFQKTSSR